MDNILITGPNASGKTTTIKSILINLIMGQQFGMGCYRKASISVYDYFHSYLNIPDTSGRDSLFQAEATVQKHRHEMALTEYQHSVNQYHRRQQIAAQTAALNNTLGSHSYLGTAGTGKTNSYLPWPSRR